jgi:hypothetical protein
VPRNFRPQQSGLEHDSGRPLTVVGGVPRRFAGRAENWNLRVSPPLGHFVARLRCPRRSHGFRRLDLLPAGEKTGKWVEQGCLHTPTAKGSLGWGALPEPFASFWPPTRAGFMPLIARSPVRAAGRPGGASRQNGAWGEGGAPLRGAWKEPLRPDLAELVPVAFEGTRARGWAGTSILEIRRTSERSGTPPYVAPQYRRPLEGLNSHSASAQTAVIQEDEGRESVTTTADTTGIFDPRRIGSRKQPQSAAGFIVCPPLGGDPSGWSRHSARGFATAGLRRSRLWWLSALGFSRRPPRLEPSSTVTFGLGAPGRLVSSFPVEGRCLCLG